MITPKFAIDGKETGLRFLIVLGKGSLKSYQLHKPLSPSAQWVIEEAI
ncbi:hypothetical protein [Prochlorococcus marinus]|nr:hypothetical protein [Prochlorococcus marinus]